MVGRPAARRRGTSGPARPAEGGTMRLPHVTPVRTITRTRPPTLSRHLLRHELSRRAFLRGAAGATGAAVGASVLGGFPALAAPPGTGEAEADPRRHRARWNDVPRLPTGIGGRTVDDHRLQRLLQRGGGSRDVGRHRGARGRHRLRGVGVRHALHEGAVRRLRWRAAAGHVRLHLNRSVPRVSWHGPDPRLQPGHHRERPVLDSAGAVGKR